MNNLTNDKKSPSKQLATKLIYNALKLLKEAGGQLSASDLKNKIEQSVDLTAWEKERYEKTGYIRWQSILAFYSIDCTKAGYILKQKGTWILTPEGEEALKLKPDELFKAVQEAYRNWKAGNNESSELELSEPGREAADEPIQESEGKLYKSRLDDIEQVAYESIAKHINSKNAYEFQDMVAALLRAMGYYTPFVAPKGKDGGVDLIAYKDPLGTTIPRIKVQVKHRQQTASVDEIRQLMGLLQKDSEVGLFISTGDFTNDSKSTTRHAQVHVELINLDRFIGLWVEFYGKLADDDKLMLPLHTVHFFAPE